MSIQLSPGVSISEIDLTTVVPSSIATVGAFAGNATWGPGNTFYTVDSETTLVSVFGEPNSNTYLDFFTAADFLAYSNNLQFVRALSPNTFNATANTSGPSIQIPNEEIYSTEYMLLDNQNKYGPFVARYAGALGNSIKIDVFDSSDVNAFSNWEFSGFFNGPPSTSSHVLNSGGANDEFHMVITDANGAISGSKGTILEIYPFMSKSSNAIDDNGISTFYKNVLLSKSQYIYSVDPIDYANTKSTWGSTSTTNFARTSVANTTFVLSGGVDAPLTDADYIAAFSKFANKTSIDVGLVLTAAASITLQQYIIDNIVTPTGSLVGRSGDSMAFISPPYNAVVNQPGMEVSNIRAWNNALNRNSSYVFVDSGWKYIYDKYNNVYRYVPLNGDTAGLCVFTDAIADPWYSIAGLNRGAIKNAVKLAWNPNQTQRDQLYQMGINPVVSFPGQGTILFGDKTFVSKPSAFDRINVRRLFITLEKFISLSAQYSLFEFNDDFTRAQFVSMVTPYLRSVQGKRGITDFLVVCDSTNNTPQVIDNNQFVGSIFIKPARSINFIQLNFVAVATGVQFSVVTGAV